MSILDDAIREHLELKRAHGADDAELKKLEDEAFGPPQRPDDPDPFAEAPTEFLVAPEVGAGEQPDEEPGARPAPNIADLQEAPEPVADSGHSTSERHAIAEQPTEMFDVEGQFEDAATESDAPSDEQLVDAELAEPRLAPVDPLAGIEASGPAETAAPAEPAIADEEPAAADEDEPADEFDEFFSEQRLSDELNQALEAPLPDEPGLAPAEETAEHRLAPAEEETAIFDVEADRAEEPVADEPAAEEPVIEEPEDEPEEPPTPPPAAAHEDVLEDTPEFLEDAPEDDNLWFEQKPPKDFDFDD
jgi:hypothetical protein